MIISYRVHYHKNLFSYSPNTSNLPSFPFQVQPYRFFIRQWTSWSNISRFTKLSGWSWTENHLNLLYIALWAQKTFLKWFTAISKIIFNFNPHTSVLSIYFPCKLNSQFSGNSQKFPTMQINSDLKSLELLGISGKERLQFCEDLEFQGIPRNSQLYKLPKI